MIGKRLTCSVAIITFNGAQYVEQQLQSILNQTIQVDEVVICDDCSEDNTVHVINSFITNHHLVNWKLLCNNSNLGYIKNAEKCILHCSGDIIFLCDQDDIWQKEKVSLILNVFNKYNECLSVTTNFRLIDSNGLFITKSVKKNNCWCYSKSNLHIENNLYKVDTMEVLNHNIAPGCTQAIRKELVSLFVACDYKAIHDYRFSILATLSGGLFYLDIPLVLYRLHEINNIGYPYFLLLRLKNEKAKIRKEYCDYLYSLLKRKIKLSYQRTEKINWLKAEYNTNITVQKWIMFAENREKLYSNQKHRFRYLIKQKICFRKEMKTVTYTNERYERLITYINDFAVLFIR